ncbi:related to SIZ1-E3-like factor in the SUMO pathway [Sporisorium reilianum f. sp. reilianum]|uniref:Related to SIZ1-E3-like factor in the SUMO pathway n=1 Tax=Sporisorium reilianum f. sp. reilianum TaxID=72559 RepID=A0A2N8UGT9_9BASI|nr:related to SIZ1-E3-like factor in the SUMO pathway [Sporisorium reilianum f. sp. reilianum]
MATDAASSGFADHALLTEAIRAMTVAQAKALIKDLNNEADIACGHLALSGNKPEIINRLIISLTERKNQGDIRGYQKFRALILRYKSPPAPTAYGYARNAVIPPAASTSAGTYGGLGAAGAYAAHPQRLGGIPTNKASSVASSSSHSSLVPLTAAAASSSLPSRPIGSAGATRINFRSSPFYEIKQFASSIVQCQEAPTQADRKNAVLFVNLSAEQCEQLKTPRYQLRLFCTTVEAHAASLSGRNPAMVEFPLTCEARVNNHTLSINLRGSKKNAGRVPPPNLNKDNMLALRGDGRPNRIELTYTNAPKRHVLVAAICEITTVETLVERLRSKQLRSKEEVLMRMRKEAEDDDIEAGAATMSLKCPFSYMRITTPCRSIHCSHVQCFDAYSFFSINEQTPSWACPTCHKTIKPEDLLMDGYVDDILKRVPQDEDSVIIEPDGQWHTADGKVTSSGVAQPGSAGAGTPIEDRLPSRDSEDVKPGASSSAKQNGGKRASPEEIVLLDSPSPPPTTAATASTSTLRGPSAAPQAASNGIASASTTHAVARPAAAPPAAAAPRHERIDLLSSSTSTSARNSPATGTPGDVIDLTLDSDDDSEPSVPTRAAPTNGAHVHAPAKAVSSSHHNHVSGGSSSSSTVRAGGFTNYSSHVSATPHRNGPFANAMARVDATPEDEQIRRPGKRPRTDGIPTPSDPRLVNGRRPGSGAGEEASRTALPASYLDAGANGNRSNGSGYGGAASAGGGGATSSSTTRGTYRDPAAARGAGDDDEGDDSWMDNTNASDQDHYLNEDEWWP